MDLDRPTPLLGGLSPATFMRRHWQKKPLLIRAAAPDPLPGFDLRAMFALAARDDVESRLVVARDDRWRLRHGPLPRRALPPLSQPGWTLLVQGVDLHDGAARRLLERFRFVPDARLDDVMLSFASDGGGVGPHVDSYDVFLLQVQGRRSWRVGRVPLRAPLREDVPLKMLAAFSPEQHWVLEPGDMLYLPPGWGHDGVAVGPCVTASIGFRAPAAAGLAAEALQRIAEAALDAVDADHEEGVVSRLYADRGQLATAMPGRIPPELQAFADAAIERALGDPDVRERALGEVLSEPKPGTWFEPGAVAGQSTDESATVRLDRRSRMLYDDRHLFVNGESYLATGSDARLMRRFADTRRLDGRARRRLSAGAEALLQRWLEAGWCRPATHGEPSGDEDA